MSIRNFYTVAQQQDFARNFQFRLESFGPVQFSNTHLVYVETASLPGRSITNVAVPYMGLSFNVPGTAQYPGSAAYKVVFRCDQDYNIRDALEQANRATFDDATSKGDYVTPPEGSTLSFTLLGKDLKPIRTYNLYGVYIQSIEDAGYDIKDTGSVQTVGVTIAYQFWEAEAKGESQESSVVDTGAGTEVNPIEWGSVTDPEE